MDAGHRCLDCLAASLQKVSPFSDRCAVGWHGPSWQRSCSGLIVPGLPHLPRNGRVNASQRDSESASKNFYADFSRCTQMRADARRWSGLHLPISALKPTFLRCRQQMTARALTRHCRSDPAAEPRNASIQACFTRYARTEAPTKSAVHRQLGENSSRAVGIRRVDRAGDITRRRRRSIARRSIVRPPWFTAPPSAYTCRASASASSHASRIRFRAQRMHRRDSPQPARSRSAAATSAITLSQSP